MIGLPIHVIRRLEGMDVNAPYRASVLVCRVEGGLRVPTAVGRSFQLGWLRGTVGQRLLIG